MKKCNKPKKEKENFDFHIRLPMGIGQYFMDECKNNLRKYSNQMTLILEERYQPKE